MGKDGCGEDNAGADGPHDGRGSNENMKDVKFDFIKDYNLTQGYPITWFS